MLRGTACVIINMLSRIHKMPNLSLQPPDLLLLAFLGLLHIHATSTPQKVRPRDFLTWVQYLTASCNVSVRWLLIVPVERYNNCIRLDKSIVLTAQIIRIQALPSR